MKRYSELKKLLEELTPEQKKLVDMHAKSGTKAPDISAHIMHSDTIRIPLEDADDGHKEPHPDVVNHLGRHGFEIPDFSHYKSGHAIDKHGRITSIGKALHKTGASEELKKTFVNDPERSTKKNSDLEVAITYHPHHVAGMSTDRGWTSCMDMDGGSNCHYLKEDIKNGTHVAYLVKKDDHEIKNPIARISLKPFTEDKFKIEPHDMFTHERHREDFAKNSLSGANSDKETDHDFHDFHVSPTGQIHVIGKHRKYGDYQIMKFNGFDGEHISTEGSYQNPEDARAHLKEKFKDKVIKTADPSAHTVLRAEKTVYGTTESGFEKTVNKWAETNFPTKADTTYKKNPKLYSDDNVNTLRTFSDEHLKAQGINIANWNVNPNNHDADLASHLFQGAYTNADTHKIYNYADEHSKANHTPDDRAVMLATRAHYLASGNYSSEVSSHELINKHLDNLREIGDFDRGRELIDRANKQNYEAYMDKQFHGNDKGKYVEQFLSSPHVRSKDIDLAIHRNSSHISEIPSHKLERHHVEQLTQSGKVHPNVIASKHYNTELHEKFVDKNLKDYEDQLSNVNKLGDEEDKFRVKLFIKKLVKQHVLSMANGGISSESIFDNKAKDHMSKKIANKLMDFSNKHKLDMSENNIAKIKFGTEKSYDDADLDQLKSHSSPEDFVENIIENKPSSARIDRMIDNGHLTTFKYNYISRKDIWNNVFKSDKAKHIYGNDLKQIKPDDQGAVNGITTAETEFMRSIDDSHHDYIKHRTTTKAFNSAGMRKDYSIIDKHIKNKNKLVAQTLHNIAIKDPEYKRYAETNQQRIDKIQ